MTFKKINKVRCINNIIDGEVCSNTSVEDSSYIIADDNGFIKTYDKSLFEIVDFTTREGNGWTIKCNDCCKEVSLDLLKRGKCPNCGQNFII